MKKLMILSVFSSLSTISFISTASTNVSGGIINFTGAVTDSTCTINGNNPASLSVALNPITTEQAGTSEGLIDAQKKAFSLDFSNCSSAKTPGVGETRAAPTLKIQFSSSNTISNDGKYLINQESDANGKPRNVGIAIVLQNSETQPIMLNQTLDTKLAGNTSKPETLNFYAKYYKADTQPAEAGTVRTMVTYSVSYL